MLSIEKNDFFTCVELIQMRLHRSGCKAGKGNLRSGFQSWQVQPLPLQ